MVTAVVSEMGAKNINAAMMICLAWIGSANASNPFQNTLTPIHARNTPMNWLPESPMYITDGCQLWYRKPISEAAMEDRISKMAGAEKFNWRTSIVDLMKLLGIDSSLANRKELAQELGYTGELDGSAEMNIWLHKAVMRKLAENGGKVPDDLKD